MSNSIFNALSNTLLAFQAGMFLVGVLVLLGGRLYLTPRRFTEGGPAVLGGLLLLVPLVVTVAVLFTVALVMHFFDAAPFNFNGYQVVFMIAEVSLVLACLGAVAGIAWRRAAALQLEYRATFTAVTALEYLGVSFVVVTAGVTWWLGDKLELWKQVVLWVLFGVALCAILWRGWVKLFGPVLFYDLVRSGRRGRFILIRFLYVSALFLVLMCVYFSWVAADYRHDARNNVERMALMADSFFGTFMTLQLLVVVLLTPAYTAGAIAEEKDRRTLEFLLATDLRNREIVLSKLVSRVANLSFMILAGLPVLCLMQFLGGVDPALVLAGFAITALTTVSIASLSILASVYAKRPRDAIALTYVAVLAYLSVPWVLEVVLTHTAGWFMNVPLTLGVDGTTIGDVLSDVNAGNVIAVCWDLGQKMSTGGPGSRLSGLLPDLVGRYARFHLLATGLLTFWAVVRLRKIALAQTFGTASRLPLTARFFGRPPVGQSPMIWKEVFAESGHSFGWLGRVIIFTFIILSFVPAVWITVDALSEWFSPTPGGFRWWRDPWEQLKESLNIWVRIAGTAVSCLMLLAVGVRAAGSVSSERDKQTLDGLLTSPLDSDAILFAKWLGSIVSVRWAWLWLGSMWLFAAVPGGLSYLAPPLLMGAWLVMAGFVAMIGVWFSTACRTSGRATVWTLLTLIFLGGGHWIVGGMCCYMPLAFLDLHGRDQEILFELHGFGLTPPMTLGLLAFRLEDLEHVRSETTRFIVFAFLGVFAWAVAAGILWVPTSERFRTLTGRTYLRRPERRPIPLVDSTGDANGNVLTQTDGDRNVTVHPTEKALDPAGTADAAGTEPPPDPVSKARLDPPEGGPSQPSIQS